MAVDQLEKEQDKVLAHEDLSPYRGQWVALRSGRVIASDVDADSLRANPAVQEDDILTPVPTQEDGIYIL